MRSRRAPPEARTPYARPEQPPVTNSSEDPENPNWLSGLIYPAKMIASGAGKILSFFGPSSSSSSSSGENDDEDDGEEVEGRLNKVFSPSSKSDNKRAIEQLVMHETFSREEGNELIKLVKSRIVNGNGTIVLEDENAANMRTTAIMEARKWLQEKRSGSKKKLESEFDVTKLATPSQITPKEKGSPVDMAKSYMHSRPAWASPSLKFTEVGSPSPLRVPRLMEETPKSALRSSELKRGSLSSGSWNILEEIRRVRSKATEELLAAAPLTKIGLSSFSPQDNTTQDSLKNGRDAVGTAPAESSQDRGRDVLPDAATNLPCGVNLDGDAIQYMELREHQEAAGLKSNEDNEVHDPRSTMAENGFSTNMSSLAPGDDAIAKPKPPGEENGDLVDSSHDVHVVEPATDVLTAGPSDTMVNGSQNSSSMQHEELSQEFSQPIADQPSTAQASDTPQKGRKSRGYSRRGRGKGK